MTLLVFLGGSSLLEGGGIDSPCPKVLSDFKTDVVMGDAKSSTAGRLTESRLSPE